MDLTVIAAISLLVISVLLLTIKKKKKLQYSEGDIFSIQNANGSFSLIKVLNEVDDIIGFSFYTKELPSRPKTMILSAMADRPFVSTLDKKSLKKLKPEYIGKTALKKREITKFMDSKKAS